MCSFKLQVSIVRPQRDVVLPSSLEVEVDVSANVHAFLLIFILRSCLFLFQIVLHGRGLWLPDIPPLCKGALLVAVGVRVHL